MNVVIIIFLLIAAYLLGSVNFSIIFSKRLLNSDVRTKGSGNAGSTNMLRSYGWIYAVLTLIFDFLKAFVVLLAAKLIFRSYVYCQLIVALVGLACVVGHCFPIFFKFKGGKGVAVGAMAILMVDYKAFIIVVVLFLISVILTRFVSLGSIVGAVAFPLSCAFLLDYTDPYDIWTLVCTIIIGLLVIYMHRSNIYRLCKGTERKFSFSNKKEK